jgi:hypothetical protein
VKIWIFTILSIFTLGTLVAQPPEKKDGTIHVGKSKEKLSGLYKKTNIIYGSISEAESRIKSDSKSGAIKSEMYFYFLPNGRLYQINSEKPAKEILNLAKNKPTLLRPVLASYALQDSILLITPLQDGIKDAMEPTKAYFEGGIKADRLYLTKININEVFVFEKVE